MQTVNTRARHPPCISGLGEEALAHQPRTCRYAARRGGARRERGHRDQQEVDVEASERRGWLTDAVSVPDLADTVTRN
jgi:hypothetical protein